MSFPYKKLLLALLCVAQVQAHDAPPEATQESFISDVWNGFTSVFTLDGGETLPIFQKITLEAQENVGITHPWPVKKLNPNYPFAPGIGAITTENTIYINETNMGQQPFGVANALMHHEAIHAKHKDARTLRWIPLTSSLVGALATHALYKTLDIQKAYWLAIISTWIVVGNLSKKILSQFIETRADRKGFKATQCAMCAQEIALDREIWEIIQQFNLLIFLQGGYVSGQEIHTIAKELEGKLCSYHTDPNNQALHEEIIKKYTCYLNNLKARKQAAAQPKAV